MRWQRGWQIARSNAGNRRFWRGTVTITLSEAKATLMEGIVVASGISGEQIVQTALNRWLEQYAAGQMALPLDGQVTREGTPRQKGRYHFTD